MNLNSAVKKALTLALMGAVPAMGLAAPLEPNDPTGGSSLIVQAWDPTTNVGLVEYLSNSWSTFLPGGSDGATSNAGTTISTQLDGTSAAFASIFGSTATIDFNVIAASLQPVPANPAYMTTNPIGSTALVKNSSVDSSVQGLSTQLGDLYLGATPACTVNPCIATGGSTDPATMFLLAVGANNQPNGVGTVANTSGAVSAALGFFEYADTGAGSTKNATKTPYTNTDGKVGQWTLSSSGDLVYSIAAGGGAVPLPAAAWLFGSGLLGLLGVGRRRFSRA